MKKTFFILALSLFINYSFAQHFIPIKLMFAKDYSAALYGGLSLDKGNGDEFFKSLSNTGNTGFVVNALYKKRGGKNGARETFTQFLVDFNPVIIGWDPFKYKLAEQSIDSFEIYKMPFSENALLHIGWHRNYLGRFREGPKDQLQHVRLFGDLYYRPYNIIDKDNNSYRFSVFNINLGTQYSYIKKDVPNLGTFLIGVSAQLNFMLTNEFDAIGSAGALSTLMGASSTGKNFMGPGGKIIVQINYLNIYIEGRQYYCIDNNHTGEKFTQEPIILVGAFTNLRWLKKKKTTGAVEEEIKYE